MRSWPRLLIATLLAGACAVTSARAAVPGPVGSEFLAGDRVLPDDDNDHLRCRDASGRINRLLSTTEDTLDPSRQVRVDREDAAGNALPPIVLDPRAWPMSIRCTPAGTMQTIVQRWETDSPYETRFFNAAGEALGRFAFDQSVFWFDGFGIHDSLGVYAVRADESAAGVALYGQWLDYNGHPLRPAVELRGASSNWPSPLATVVDTAGNVLVTWGDIDDSRARQIVGQMVDSAGNLLGPVFTLSQTSPRHLWARFLATDEAVGRFTVYWYTDAVDGRVARMVSVDPDSFVDEIVTTTTLPPPDDNLSFSPEHQIGIISLDAPYQSRTLLSGDGEGTWLAGWWQGWWQERWDREDHDYSDYRFVISRSVDNGRHWQATYNADLRGDFSNVVASPDGAAMAISATANSGLRVSLLAAGATQWQMLADLNPPALPPSDQDIARYGSGSGSVATDGSGIWGVAWPVYERNNTARSDAMRVFAAFSYDNGQTWQLPREVARLEGEAGADIHLDTNGKGGWILAWQTVGGHAIWTSRSTTDGFSWDEAHQVFELVGLGYQSWDYTWPQTLDLRHAGGQSWLMTFASSTFDVSTYGADGDIFALHSDNDGESWSAPVAVNGQARVDAATDANPSLDVNADGEAMVVWKSHDSLGDLIGNDADIVRATSSDAGATWNWPVAVNAGAGNDTGVENHPVLAAGKNGTWLAAWLAHEADWSEMGYDLMVAAAPFHCGDGIKDEAEDCDDGNDIADDGCDPNCTVSGCGNGIVNDGEECDDGNDLDDDACVQGCRFASCGDGFRRAGVEACDEGATGFEGACLPDCTPASCGDGHVWVGEEACDDANTDDQDSCTSNCWPAVCGDGVVWTGHEECDDRGYSGSDSCIACKFATCGDGFVRAGLEECDPAAPPIPFHVCQADCHFAGTCDQDTPTPRYKASDALVILRIAVGIEGSCALAICDLDGNGHVTINDALAALRFAVAALKSATCFSTTTVAFVLEDPQLLGSLTFQAYFPPELGNFLNGEIDGDCTSPVPGVFVATNARGQRRLTAGVISLQGFAGPIDLVVCKFHHVPGNPPVTADFALTIVDATDVDGSDHTSDVKLRVAVR